MRKSKYDKRLLEPIVKSSKSIGTVLDKLGLRRTGGNYNNISGWIRFNELDISHFKGQGWSKGENRKTNLSVEKFSKKKEIPDNEIFISNSRYMKGYRILHKLVNNFKREYKCEICGINEWLNKKITLHLDHVNGVHNDNRMENLRIVCPNCHQQTETWGAKK